ncbi:MAG: GNAT family N-acetyltransferase [Actinomycetia bacterium]|nr:GNAT family N-acetyltransferase [Actinomycetes bacterium]
MRDLGTRALETARLRLRPLTAGDAEDMFANWACDPEVTAFLTWQPHASAKETREVLTAWVAHYDDPSYYHWTIESREAATLIGTVGVVGADAAIEMKEIGYCLGRPWWGRGYASEALAAVIEYLFDDVGANRIEAQHDPANVASGRVLAKCGMRQEGILRDRQRCNRGIADAVMWAILAKDYRRPT